MQGKAPELKTQDAVKSNKDFTTRLQLTVKQQYGHRHAQSCVSVLRWVVTSQLFHMLLACQSFKVVVLVSQATEF